MLLSHRKAGLAALGAWVETRALVHTAYRLHIVRNKRVVCEDRLFLPTFDRKGALDRPIMTVVLAGRARIRAFGVERWLKAGDVALIGAKAAVEMRQEGDRFESVAFEYDPGLFGGGPRRRLMDGRLSKVDLARIAAAASTLFVCGDDERLAALEAGRLLSVLASTGLPIERVSPAALVEVVPRRAVQLSQALDRVLSSLDVNPMMVDLNVALGVSSRQVNRLVTAFNRRYGFNSVGWRDTRNRRRLMIGAVLLTAPGATTESIAAAVGYGAPTALCHAFAEAGLPSPGAIAASVANSV